VANIAYHFDVRRLSILVMIP
jgi:hypothetical protein